jgi:hypothetical protein
VQRRRQRLVAQRLDDLDDARHPGRRLRVADVRLDRAEPQRPVRALAPVRRQQRLRLDRIAERRPGAVALDASTSAGESPRSPAPGG